MFCQKCGNAIQNGEKFCRFCGNPVIQNAQTPTPFINTPPSPAIKKTANKKYIIPSIIGAVVIVAVLVLGIIYFAENSFENNDSTGDYIDDMLSPTESNNEFLAENTEGHTNGAPSIEPTKPAKDFTADMTVEEFAQKVTELIFYGKYDEVKKYFLDEELVDYFPLEEGMDDLEYVLKRDECLERLNKGMKYDVLFEHYETEEMTISEHNENFFTAICEEFGIEGLNGNIDYSKITEAYIVDIAVYVTFDDNYQDSGNAMIYVVRCGNSWRCTLGLIDM